jgi:gelsolin
MCTFGTAIVLDQGSDEDDDFWGFLGEGEIGEAAPEDEEPEEFAPVLYRVDGDPTKPLEEVSTGSPIEKGASDTKCLPKQALDDGDVFLVDAGWELFVWIGKSADLKEKIAALGAADRLAEVEPRVNYLPVTVVKSGSETDEFLAYFD